jgi:hypothetical protein
MGAAEKPCASGLSARSPSRTVYRWLIELSGPEGSLNVKHLTQQGWADNAQPLAPRRVAGDNDELLPALSPVIHDLRLFCDSQQ